MRLALVCTEKLPVPPVRGGAIQIYIAGVAPLLAERAEVAVYGIADPSLPEVETEAGGALTWIRFPADRYDDAVSAHVAAAGYDLVHVFNRPLRLLRIAAASPGTRLTLSLHNEMLGDAKISTAHGRACVERCAAIITVSRYIADTVRRRFPAAAPKLRVIYSGVDLDRYPPRDSEAASQLRAAFRLARGIGDDPVVLNVSRTSKVKGQHVLIQAMRRVLRSHPEARLVIVGGSWYGTTKLDDYHRRLREMAKPLGDRVIFTNYVPPDQVVGAFFAGDLFVGASQWQEPLARVHIEAMAAGLPVITTRRGGNPEAVEQGRSGIVLDEFDRPEAFAEAIALLLSDRGLAAALGARGREIAVARFGWRRVAAELMEVFQSAAASAPLPGPA